MSDENGISTSGSEQFGFNCPDCGNVNIIETENGPEGLKGRIYKCDCCGEDILLNRYVGTERSRSDDDLVTDGGIDRARYRRREAESVQQQAGVGDQGSACPHGVEDCPGPHGAGLPCYECFWEVPDDG